MTDTSKAQIEFYAKRLEDIAQFAKANQSDFEVTPEDGKKIADALRALLAERDDLQARRKEFEADNIRLGRALGEMQGHTFFCQDSEGVLRRWYPPAAVPMFQPGEVVASPTTAAKGEGA